jgi:hypothetical protein
MPCSCLARTMIALCLLATAAGKAGAWGPQGHVIVATLAEQRLTPKARATVRALLDDRSMTESRLANWADYIKRNRGYRRTYPNNDRWHYVDIPFDAAGFDRDRVGHKGDNVIDAIDRCRRVLLDRKAEAGRRKEALLFLIHLVGDLHQPLHCADRNNDRGGNLLAVTYPGDDRPRRSLHLIWDLNLVEEGLGALETAEYVRRLTTTITAAQAKAWGKGKAADWAWESHQLAVRCAYRDAAGKELPRTGVVALDKDYVKKNSAVVQEQLKKAGVRLARVLNEILGE